MRLALPVMLACCAALQGRADDRVARLLDRLAREASLFERNAPSVIGEETLRQRAFKGGKPDEPQESQAHVVVSEYTFARLGEGGIREFRRVTSVDGRKIEPSHRAMEALARSVRSGDERERKRVLEEFAKHGLAGAASDIGQLILLFDKRNLERYEIQLTGEILAGAEQCFVYSYKQIEGPEGVTVWQKGKAARQKLTGEIVARKSDYLPLRISFASVVGEGKRAVREEGEVEYAKTRFGFLLPASVVHREYRAGRLAVENVFYYNNFQQFGASTSVTFDAPAQDQK